ncbi:T9SS type A sorting domain-containing protein [Chitinophaga agri]|uniref:PKD domain-containing protein n=1 Tax=Chitinophaga agri TaxID=2703787 RepID=A0A6B9ZDN7_9BACT|nr:PKD domain-containing protein [Chitinophaga agri]QHS60247.1 PKD domain-containing protein [Chitinophaga agri]
MKKTLLLFVLVYLCHFLYAQPGPKVHFDLSRRQSCNAPVTINFKDMTSHPGKSGIVSWKWYFGDGTVDSTSGPKVAHRYTRHGVFPVRLVVRDKHGRIGADSLSGDNLVRIGAMAQLPATVTLPAHGAVTLRNLAAPLSFDSLGTYKWYRGNRLISTARKVTVTDTGRITLRYTACGRTMTAQTLVVVTPVDTSWKINISVEPESPCGDVFKLFANITTPDSSYALVWSTGELTPYIRVTTEGVYTAVLRDLQGNIHAVDTATVTFNKPFRATLELHPGAVPGSDTLIASPSTEWWYGYNYRWYRDNILILNTNSPQLYDPQPGVYKVFVQNDAGCNDISDTLHYNVDTTALQVDYTYRISACDPRSIGFNGIVKVAPGDAVVSYLWDFDNYSGGTTKDTYQHFDQPGTYDVSFSVITASGRTASVSKQFVIPYVAPWTAHITAQPNACGDTVFLTLNSSPQASYYYWSSGQTSQTIAVTESGYYIAGAEDSCFAIRVMDTIQVTINRPFTAEIRTYSQDTLYAWPLNDTLPARYSYTWYRNDTVYSNASALSMPEPGIYRLRVTGVNGCSSLSSPYYYNVPIDTAWDIQLETYGQVTCVDSIWVFANVRVPADKHYYIAWQNGQGGNAFIARTSGYYTARLFDDEGHLRAEETMYIMITSHVNASLEIHGTPVPGNDTLVAYPQTQWWTGYFYRWYRDGVEVLAGNAPYLYYATPGTYVVYVRSDEGCDDWSDPVSYGYADSSAVRPPTVASLDHLNRKDGDVSIKTYPNPSTGKVYIQFDKPLQQAMLIRVYNLQGGVVYTRSTAAQQQLLELSHLPKGYYIIELTGNGVKQTRSLLLQ